MVLCTGKKRLYSLVHMHKRKYINTVAFIKSCIHSTVSELVCFSLLFGKCVNWSIDKTIYFICHYIQSNDSLTALDTNNSWLPHYHKYMYWFFKCTGKCTDIEGFLISLIQIIQAFFICTFDFSTKMSIFIGSNVNLVSAIICSGIKKGKCKYVRLTLYLTLSSNLTPFS